MKSKKRKAILKRNRMGMVSIAVVALLLFGVLFVEGRSLSSRLSSYDKEVEDLNDRIEEENERTKEIDELKEYMDTDEYAEEVARDKLGLVKDNEIVFKEAE